MLIGRDAEVARARELLLGGTSLVIFGEAGIGKTSLLSAALEGRDVVVAQCFQLLSWSAGFPLQQAIGRPVPAGDPAWTARWLAGRLGPDTILRVEDAQWADPLTRDVLALLPDVVVAASVRSGEPASDAMIGQLVGAGAERLDLAPLDTQSAVRLAEQRHPQLSGAQVAALARRCGGNPLLIEEVADDASADHALRRSVTRRLSRLAPAAREAFGTVVLAGEPVPAAWVDGVDALCAAGLLVRQPGAGGDDVVPRHPLLAEAATTVLGDDPDEVRHLAAVLAERARSARRLPLAARALALAGDRDGALACAVEAAGAADRPGDSAALLQLAAEVAPPELVAELTVRAVEQLVTAGEFVRAAPLVDRLPGRADAHWNVLVGRVRWETGDDDAAVRAYETALADASADIRDHIIARCEHARAVVLAQGDIPRALELARRALDEARAADVELARALAVLGTVEHFVDHPDGAAHLAEAIDRAREAGDVLVELTAANNLVATHETLGNQELARSLADRYAGRAAELRLGGWELQLTAMAVNVCMHLGDYDRVLAEVPELLTRTAQPRTRDQLENTLALTLIDVGRGVEVLERVDAALVRSVDDLYGRGNLTWIRAEALLWNGEFAAAARTADEAVTITGSGLELFPLITGLHARVLAGLPIDDAAWPEPYTPLLRGVPVEREALVALSVGDRAGASTLFARAADAWAPYHRRGELRCRWFAADCEPEPGVATDALLALEADLAQRGWAPLLGRTRQSLRRLGVRRAAPRGRVGELTAREREIVDLVAQGLSTNEIAARLSLSRATVAAQIASARARLGAATRWQAASG